MIDGKQLVQALDNAESIVVITDANGVINFVNKTFERVYGYARAEAIGKTPNVLKSGYHTHSFYENMWETLAGGNSWKGDFINRAKNGELIIEKASISPIFSRDNVQIVGFIAVKENVSIQQKLKDQLQEREQLFEKMFENSPVGMLILNPRKTLYNVDDYEIVKVNPRFKEIMGNPSALGRLLSEIFESKHLVKGLMQARREGVEMLEWQHSPLDKSLRLRLFALNESQDCLLVSDVSVQKQMELRLMKSEAHLRKLNDTKDKFFSIIAHDLKNPFQTIIGFASLLNHNLESFTPAELKQMVQQITKASERTYKLLEDLLTWSKSQLGQLTPNPGRCNACDLVGKVFKQLDALAVNKGIELSNEIADPVYCHADPDMMEFVLRNLIHNGIKFTHDGGKVICRARQKNGSLTIQVHDSGIGIHPTKLKSIFSLNGNDSTPGTSEELGTGLGLVLVHEMVELNKGQISVESEPGEGTCFTLLLPVSDAAAN